MTFFIGFMKKKITFIRHGESIFNKYKNDIKDCGLTDHGIDQSKKIDGDFDYIICSPLKRCLQTLENSNIKNKNIFEINHLFREYKTDKCDFLEFENENYENEEEILNRIEESKKYLSLLDHLNICIISHSDFIFYFTSIKKNNELFGKWLSNCESIILYF
jgi:phosphohistidine phosphatase SixA